MVAIIAFAVALFLAAIVPLTTLTAHNAAKSDVRDTRESDLREVGRALAIYLDKHTNPPASLDILKAEAGNAFIEKFQNLPYVGYAVSPILRDNNWEYRRVVVFAQDTAAAKTTNEYLSDAGNTCGTGSFASADSWCGDKNSKWFRIETRELYGDWIKRQKLRQNATIHKLAVGFNEAGQFPAVAGGYATLLDLTSYTATADTCKDVHVWNKIPFDCNDLFSVFGTPVTLNRVTNETVSLVSRTPIINSDGTNLAVVTLIPLDID